MLILRKIRYGIILIICRETCLLRLRSANWLTINCGEICLLRLRSANLLIINYWETCLLRLRSANWLTINSGRDTRAERSQSTHYYTANWDGATTNSAFCYFRIMAGESCDIGSLPPYTSSLWWGFHKLCLLLLSNYGGRKLRYRELASLHRESVMGLPRNWLLPPVIWKKPIKILTSRLENFSELFSFAKRSQFRGAGGSWTHVQIRK